MLKYYRVWEDRMGQHPGEMARAITHLEYIRRQEREASLRAAGLIK